MGEDLGVRFCANCGQPEAKAKLLVDNFCPDCYRKLHPLFSPPDYVSLAVCTRCGSMRVKKRWVGPVRLSEAVGIALRQTNSLQPGAFVETEETEIPPHTPELRLNVNVRGKAHAGLAEHEEQYNLLLRLNWETCTHCLETDRKTLPYKLQLRGDVGLLTPRNLRAANLALNEALHLHPSRFERREAEGGIDLEFENPRCIGEILAILRNRYPGEEHTSSEGVAKLSNGGEVVKRTYVYRFLSFDIGEVLHVAESDLRIEGVEKGRVHVYDLKTNKRSTLPIDLLLDAKSESRA